MPTSTVESVASSLQRSEFDEKMPTVLGAANSIARAVHSATDPIEVLRATAHAFKRSTGVTRCSIALPEKETGMYRISLSLGRTDYTAMARTMLDGSDGLSKEILDRHAPVVVQDSLTDPLVREWESVSRSLGAYSLVGFPLTFGDDVVGLGFIDCENQRTAFTPWQIEAAGQLGALCGSQLAMAAMLDKQRQTLDVLHGENVALKRLIRVEQLLKDVTAGGLSPAAVANNAARLLGRPVSIHDRQWRIVAQGTPDGAAAHRLTDLGQRQVLEHPRVQRELDLVRRTGEARVIAAIPVLGIHHRCIVAPIDLGAEHWGNIVVHEFSRPFQPVENEVANRVGARFGTAIATANRNATTIADLRAAVLQDLLTGEADRSDLSNRAEVAGLTSANEQILVLFHAPSPAAFASEEKAALMKVTRECLGDEAIFTLIDDHEIAVIADAPSGGLRALRDRLGRMLLQGHESDGTRAVISESFSDIAEVRDLLIQCRQAARCVHRFRHKRLPHAVLVSDFGPSLPFLASVDVEEARAFARANLKELDNSIGEDDLVVTARVFLASANVRKAARALAVHENTVRYRLARIQKITGLDLLNDTGDQLKADLSIVALRLVGDVPWDQPVELNPPV